jgi:hypothetical protein
MNRGTGIVLGAALGLASGLAMAACSQDASDATYSSAAAEGQTTQAVLPVVTVYKSPT